MINAFVCFISVHSETLNCDLLSINNKIQLKENNSNIIHKDKEITDIAKQGGFGLGLGMRTSHLLVLIATREHAKAIYLTASFSLKLTTACDYVSQ